MDSPVSIVAKGEDALVFASLSGRVPITSSPKMKSNVLHQSLFPLPAALRNTNDNKSFRRRQINTHNDIRTYSI
jgi:hypothetical protein